MTTKQLIEKAYAMCVEHGVPVISIHFEQKCNFDNLKFGGNKIEITVFFSCEEHIVNNTKLDFSNICSKIRETEENYNSNGLLADLKEQLKKKFPIKEVRAASEFELEFEESEVGDE